MSDAPALLIFPAGGPLVVDVEESCARLGRRIGAVVANRPGPRHSLDPSRILDVGQLPLDAAGWVFLCPLFTPANRRLAVAEALGHGWGAADALIDPTAIVPPSVEAAEGVYVNAGVVIGAASRLGAHVLINRAASLGHHCEIEAFASIGPAVVLAGQVRVGEGAVIGTGAVLASGVSVGAGASVAPGTVLRRDLPPGAVAFGPSTPITIPGEPRE
jgi:UDP-3-O-[3-hydroxymyristoyl] glucosamine N-acyltransferase